jgi:uncharacterized protein
LGERSLRRRGDDLGVTVEPQLLVLLLAAALGAGFVDAIAGGGGLLTVPVLLACHLPPHIALGTNKGQSTFGAVSSAVSFWRKNAVDRKRAPWAFVGGLTGAIAGASLLLRVRPEPLRPIIIALLVAAAVFVAARPHVAAAGIAARWRPLALAIVTFGLGMYDGFFGPGVGTMLIVAFTIVYGESITSASANAKVVNLASNLASLAIFASTGRVIWQIALPMAVANACGAALGAKMALKHGDRYVRTILLMVVAALVVKLTWDAMG